MTNVPGRADHAAATGPIFGYTVPEVRKAIVNLIGLLTALLAADLLPSGWNVYVSAAVGILTVIAHFQVSNDPVPPAA